MELNEKSRRNDIKAKTEPVQKYRDLLRSVQKEDDNATYMLLGIENQDEIHLAMPVKNMHYDVLQYEKQIQEYKEENEKRGEKFNSKEFLVGLKVGQKLKPVITIVVYWGEKEWDAPLTLKDLLNLDEIPLELMPYISDYRIPIVDVRHAKNLEWLNSSVREVFQFLQCSKDKKALVKTITENSEQFCLDTQSIAVISYYTNIPQDVKIYLDRKRKKGEDNMCQALIDWVNDSKREGKEEGKIEGKAEGKIEGRIELAQAMIETLKKKGFSREEILKMLVSMNMSEEEIAQVI